MPRSSLLSQPVPLIQAIADSMLQPVPNDVEFTQRAKIVYKNSRTLCSTKADGCEALVGGSDFTNIDLDEQICI